MIDINIIRTNRKLVEDNLKKKYQENKLPILDEIIELDKTVLKINCGENNVVFSGNDIEIAEYSFDGFKIKGDIKNIEFK